MNNIPIGQFYKIAVDDRDPYWIYGGLQDTHSWMGPSATRHWLGILNQDWVQIGFSDGTGQAVDKGRLSHRLHDVRRREYPALRSGHRRSARHQAATAEGRAALSVGLGRTCDRIASHGGNGLHRREQAVHLEGCRDNLDAHE